MESAGSVESCLLDGDLELGWAAGEEVESCEW